MKVLAAVAVMMAPASAVQARKNVPAGSPGAAVLHSPTFFLRKIDSLNSE